jgi:hypothetical protein
MSQTTDAEAPWGRGWSHPSMPGPRKPRPIGITSAPLATGVVITQVLMDDGSIFYRVMANGDGGPWKKSPPIPQENGT